MNTTLPSKVSYLLEKELGFIDFAIHSLESDLAPFEQKYAMKSTEFLTKFENGELGDDRAWFEWHGLALSVQDWYDTKTQIRKTLSVA